MPNVFVKLKLFSRAALEKSRDYSASYLKAHTWGCILRFKLQMAHLFVEDTGRQVVKSTGKTFKLIKEAKVAILP
ncbi:MAG: hypothetical protein V2A69_07600 [Pseudomonadota bacterium]